MRALTLFNADAPKGLSPEKEEEIMNNPKTSTRIISKHWPRCPDGPPYLPGHSLPGYQASKHFPLWGASLLNFYRMNRFPSNYPIPFVVGVSVTTSTSSKLYRWVKSQPKELAWDDPARRDCMSMAACTPVPHEVEPWSTSKAILAYEEPLLKLIHENDPATIPFRREENLGPFFQVSGTLTPCRMNTF